LRIQTIKKWEKPSSGLIKINCDAYFQENLKSAGWGFVIRDDDGDVIQAARGKLNHVLDVFQAELIACLQGLLIFGITKIILATDAIQVQQAIASEEENFLPMGGLLRETKEIAMLNFSSFSCVFESRECNKVAHALAKLGSECGDGRAGTIFHSILYSDFVCW
jgi:hypothetical protein